MKLPVEEAQALPSVTRAIRQEDIRLYAEASGDFNPIHVDEEFAKGTPFGGTIAHGMMVAASLSEVMGRAFGIAWARSGRMKLRFKAPVRPGDTITAGGTVKAVRVEGDDAVVDCSLEVRRQDGQAAITGTASVRLRGMAAQGHDEKEA